MICFIGIVRPLDGKGANRLEILNEYTILLLYCICVTQTNFVEDVRGRMAMGWALITLISLNILTNFGLMFYADFRKAYRKIKLLFVRRKRLLEIKEERERQERVDAYRKVILDDLNQQQLQQSQSSSA